MKYLIIACLFIFCATNIVGQKNIVLKNGKTIKVNPKSAEDYIVAFLNDSTSMQDTTFEKNWFVLEKTNFMLGKPILEYSSLIQMKNIASILKAYPKLKIAIGCHSDVTGNENSNIILTQSRADAYKKYLIFQGVSKTKITEAVGYGSKFAKYKTATSYENHQEDRKIDIKIVSF